MQPTNNTDLAPASLVLSCIPSLCLVSLCRTSRTRTSAASDQKECVGFRKTWFYPGPAGGSPRVSIVSSLITTAAQREVEELQKMEGDAGHRARQGQALGWML